MRAQKAASAGGCWIDLMQFTSRHINLVGSAVVHSEISAVSGGENTRAIVIFTDAAYFPLAYVLALSAQAEAHEASADVFVFTDDVGLVERYAGRSAIFVRYADPSGLIPANASKHYRITKAARYRLFLGEILPSQYERALYLDCDIVLEPGFAAILSIDLHGHPIAAALDGGDIVLRTPRRAAERRQYLTDIGIEPDAGYFNSGVLLIDMDAWRACEVPDKTMAFLANRGDRTRSLDQDALNFVFQGNWQRLSQRWNFQFQFMGLGIESDVNPLIWHYTGDYKPWLDVIWPHERDHVDRFRALFANSDWPDFVQRHRTDNHDKIARKARLHRLLTFLKPGSRRRKAARIAAIRGHAIAVLTDEGVFTEAARGGVHAGRANSADST